MDRSDRFCRACTHRIDERPMEADVESLVRAGVDTDRLEGAGSLIHRLAPTRRDSVVRDTANGGSRRRDSHGLPGWRDRHLRIGEFYPPLVPLITAMLAWLGIYLRDERVRALLPFRRRPGK